MRIALLKRERRLPDGVSGRIERAKNARVGVKDVVARGAQPAPYIVIDAARELRLRKPSQLEAKMVVTVGDEVAQGELLAGKLTRRGKAKKGKAILAPRAGIVTYIGQGRIILQETPVPVEVESGLAGIVIDVDGTRGLTIEGYGGVLQGVWGNGRRALGLLRAEPSDGLESAFNEAIDAQYRGAILYTRRPLKPLSLQVMEDQGFAGIIAPSMAPEMIDAAMLAKGAILLTEGFGEERMNPTYLQFLSENDGRQTVLDALTPSPLSVNHPEALFTVPLGDTRPPSFNSNVVLRAGMTVHVTRGDGSTATGLLTDLPKAPVLLDNGLRVPCAVVKLATGEVLEVPLANIEVYG